MLVEAYLNQLERRRLSGVAASIRRNYAGTQSQTLVRRSLQLLDVHLPELTTINRLRQSFRVAAVDVENLLSSKAMQPRGSVNPVKLL